MSTENDQTKGFEKAARENQKAADEAGADQVQERFDEAEEKGFFGESQDETPREHYTLQGVGQGKPTPETDPEQRQNQPRRSF